MLQGVFEHALPVADARRPCGRGSRGRARQRKATHAPAARPQCAARAAASSSPSSPPPFAAPPPLQPFAVPLLCLLLAAGSYLALSPPIAKPQAPVGLAPAGAGCERAAVADATALWERVATDDVVREAAEAGDGVVAAGAPEGAPAAPPAGATPPTSTRAALGARFGLAPRDARLLNSDPGGCSAALLPRPRALLLRLPTGRLLIGATEAWAPSPGDGLARELKARMAAERPGPGTPFELCVLDAALEVELAALRAVAADLEAEGRSALAALAASPSPSSLERVRVLRGHSAPARARAQALARELARLLDDDDEMRALVLSAPQQQQLRQQQQQQQQAQQAAPHGRGSGAASLAAVEDGLELHRAAADAVSWRLHLLDEAVDDTESFVARDLDAKRNTVMRLNVVIAVYGFSERLLERAAEGVRARRLHRQQQQQQQRGGDRGGAAGGGGAPDEQPAEAGGQAGADEQEA